MANSHQFHSSHIQLGFPLQSTKVAAGGKVSTSRGRNGRDGQQNADHSNRPPEFQEVVRVREPRPMEAAKGQSN